MGVRTAENMMGVSMCVVILRRSNAHHYTALGPEQSWWRAGSAPVQKRGNARCSSTDLRRPFCVTPASLLAIFAGGQRAGRDAGATSPQFPCAILVRGCCRIGHAFVGA